MPSLDDITEIKAEKILGHAKELMEDLDLGRILNILEKKLLEEDYTSLDLAAALLRLSMGEENQDIIDDYREARSLDDLGSQGRGRDSHGYGRKSGGHGGRSGGRGGRSGRGGDMARLFINIGKDQNVKPGDILGAIAGESGIPGRLVGSIDMYDKYTFIEVPDDCAGEILESMKSAKIRGKKVHMEMANTR